MYQKRLYSRLYLKMSGGGGLHCFSDASLCSLRTVKSVLAVSQCNGLKKIGENMFWNEKKRKSNVVKVSGVFFFKTSDRTDFQGDRARGILRRPAERGSRTVCASAGSIPDLSDQSQIAVGSRLKAVTSSWRNVSIGRRRAVFPARSDVSRFPNARYVSALMYANGNGNRPQFRILRHGRGFHHVPSAVGRTRRRGTAFAPWPYGKKIRVRQYVLFVYYLIRG